MGLSSILRSPEAAAQKVRDDAQWEYKVGVFSYNPGERLTDERRAATLPAGPERTGRPGLGAGRLCLDPRYGADRGRRGDHPRHDVVLRLPPEALTRDRHAGGMQR